MNYLNCIDSQILILQVLSKADLSTIQNIIGGYAYSNCENQVRNYFQLCVSFAVIKKKRSTYCDSFESTCKVIVSQQNGKPENKVFQYEYLREMGWPNNVQINRIRKGDYLKPQHITNLCDKFGYEMDKRFWRNQILSFFPNIQFPDEVQNDNIEYDTLKFLLENISTFEELESVLNKLSEKDQEILYNISKNDSHSDLFENSPCKLYNVIDKLLKSQHITIANFVEDDLETSTESWYKWKKKWEWWEDQNDEDKNNIRNLPNPRIKRKYLLILAITCKLKYIDTVRLLQIAGYRLGNNSKDIVIIDYLLNRNDEAERVKRFILDNVP